MISSYSPVTQDEKEAEHNDIHQNADIDTDLVYDSHRAENQSTLLPVSRRRTVFDLFWNIFVPLLAFGSVTILVVIMFHDFEAHQEPAKGFIPKDYAKTATLKPVYRRFAWNTMYSPRNHTQSDHLWDAILPSHGFVAMDRNWAAQNQWPESMYLPSDASKGVYLLEAYHQLHCLRIIRKTFWEAIDQRPFTYHPSSHMEHCFDTLRQSIQCNADNTPLYTFGDKTAGDGQLHRCRDWNELKDFATTHTACYRDTIGDVPLGEHFGFCDDGDDGLVDDVWAT